MQVTVTATVEEAKRAVATESFLVAIVDLTLPDGSGLEVLDELRESGSAAHVIVLSESPAERDQVHALLRGADEFVVKPFSLQELTASAVAMRRRADPRRAASTVQVGHCEIDMRARLVRCGGRLVDLTSKEFDLFAYLAVRPGHAFTREDLLKAVWRSASEWQQPATVTEHIRRLRNKVEPDPRHPVILVTVRGTGYRLDLPSTSDVEQAGTGPSVQVGVLIHIHGRIVFADEVAGDVAGVEADALVGMQILDLVAPISLAAATERLADGEAGRQRRSEVMRFVRFDGDEVTVEVRSTATDWHGQPARRVQLTLVSDAPTRLRRLVTGVLSEVADAVIITDVHRHIRSWNAAAERVYGWAEAAVLGRHVLDILQWDGDNGQLVEAWDQLDRSGRWSGTFTQVTRDGSTVDILGSKSVLRDDTGETIGTVSVNRLAEVAGRAPTPELDAELAARVEQGIADDEFVVFYQPVVDLVDGHLLALEALVRWEHPDRGCLAPSEFLDAAERSGLIVDLGELVLTKACVQAAEWRADGADIVLSVNVSTRQLASSGLAERFIDILQASGFNPAHLWLEVTETAVVEEFDKAAQTLRTLVGLGAGVSIDDFGTGWASLTYLQTFPVHALKIDGSFVAGAGINSNDTAIVRAVLSLGAELGLYVIAEGIETAEQRAFLATMGTTLGQGYFFGRPTSAAEVPIERARRIPTEVALERVVPSGRSDAHSEDDGPTPPVDPQGRQVATIVRDRRRPRTSSPAPAPQGALTSAVAADRIESDAVANLLRGLLRVNAAPAAAALLQKTVRQMGGTIVAAADAGDDALPVDVSLGEGPSMVVEVERFTVARMQLERLLPRLVEDARQAVDLLRRTERLKDDTTRDPLTGLRNRRALDLVLPARRSGSVVMVDLDQFKGVNDGYGHGAGDEILGSFGRVLDAQVRADDAMFRIGGDEFVILLADVDAPSAVALVERLRTSWSTTAPLPVTFSAGVAPITPDGGTAALLAADRALYRAKDLGRDRTVEAPPADVPAGFL